jgi:3'-5' exoribonuclease
MQRLPTLRELAVDTEGFGFFLCCGKELRQGRNGAFVALVLQDKTGVVSARIFDEVDRLKGEFDAGEFVKVHGVGDMYNGRLQLVIKNIRRVNPEQDRPHGFSEEACIPCAPRPIPEMWAELERVVTTDVTNPFLRQLLVVLLQTHEAKIRTWPAALLVHHAYRGGLLEHILKIVSIVELLAAQYDADRELLIAGAILHDIGKLQELDYDLAASYSRDGHLIGHIGLGLIMIRDAMRGIPDFPEDLRVQLEHLVLSHHGSKEFGSPVEPMTVEAFILSAVDDLDAKLHQIRRHVVDDEGAGAFTPYHTRLRRVLYKGGTGRRSQ